MFDLFADQLTRFFTWVNAWFWFQAMVKTMGMTVIGCGLGAIFGYILVFIRRTPGWYWSFARLPMIFYVEIFRRIPFLVLLFLVLFVLQTTGLDVQLFTVACISVTIISTAFIAEIIRAGLDSVHQTQWDTAESLNFGRIKTLGYVVMPQAWKVILPPAFAFFVMFIKDTALASQVGVLELTLVGKLYNNRGISAILAFGTCLILYFILSFPLTNFGWWMEKRLGRRKIGIEEEEGSVMAGYQLRHT